MKSTIETLISTFGASAKSKLSNPSAKGQPEDQLRAPFEQLLTDIALLSGHPSGSVVAVGESALIELKSRPDYSVTVGGALVGFVELKAPDKGADPKKFTDPHDKSQWEKLRQLPNLMYSDGNEFSVWQQGKLVGAVVKLNGDVKISGAKLSPPPGLHALFESFLSWTPTPPKTARELAHTTARLCLFLREAVTEQLALKSPGLTALAADWRKLLFPDASDERFADGYAQAVTFGLLMARAKSIPLAPGLEQVAAELAKSSSLIGAALKLLIENEENRESLKTSLDTLTRVLGVVDWKKISKGEPDTWLYFYEEFLAVYDKTLRRRTGSYYTPPEVVSSMVSLVDDVLRSDHFKLQTGLAEPSVTIVDPATGTGTFMLGLLRKITDIVKHEEGEGAVKGAVATALKRLIAFEMQLGPYAVAQLRILAEVVELTGSPSTSSLRMYVTNTLGDPYDDSEYIPGFLAALGKSRKEANKIKRDEEIRVVIGNPPYKEKARGKGGWVERKSPNSKFPAPLTAWMPPKEWGVGAHSKHLRNLYIYFWRWATWKVFDQTPDHDSGIICFITVAGFLSGPGFEKMRDYLRRRCNAIWIIDCSPEGHQPKVSTRIFEGVQQPVCIVMAARSKKADNEVPAIVQFRSLPKGDRESKFTALQAITLNDDGWSPSPSEWRAPFLPQSEGIWAAYPALESFFIYNGSGVMPGRTWIIAPDEASLKERWIKLIGTSDKEEKEALFHAHMRNGEPGDKHSQKIVATPLFGHPAKKQPVAEEKGTEVTPVQYAFRSFDRQYIIPDARLINQPNPELWRTYSDKQVFFTALSRTSPTIGPAMTITSLIPDLDHYRGSFGGRVFPLWRDAAATESNIKPKVLSFLSDKLGIPVSAEAFMAYMAMIAASRAYALHFATDLATPGLRIPVTLDPTMFQAAVELGNRIIWLHTFGERMIDPAKGRPHSSPRLPKDSLPVVPREGAISGDAADMPDTLSYDPENQRLLVGKGFISHVPIGVWNYRIAGKQVLVQWFRSRQKSRERPVIGERREHSKLSEIQPEGWLSSYTTELLKVINILAMLIELESAQTSLLEKICTGPLISNEDLLASGALDKVAFEKPKKAKAANLNLFSMN